MTSPRPQVIRIPAPPLSPGRAIRQAREARGLTRSEVYQEAGLGGIRPTYSFGSFDKFETAFATNPRAVVLRKLERYFDLEPDTLTHLHRNYLAWRQELPDFRDQEHDALLISGDPALLEAIEILCALPEIEIAPVTEALAVHAARPSANPTMLLREA